MSKQTDVTVNENHENETTEVVATVPTFNFKIAKIAAASFTAGAAVATLILKVKAAYAPDADVFVLETSNENTETQD